MGLLRLNLFCKWLEKRNLRRFAVLCALGALAREVKHTFRKCISWISDHHSGKTVKCPLRLKGLANVFLFVVPLNVF